MSETGQVTCTACGATNPAAAPVCRTCGRALPGLADRLFTTDDATPATPATPSAPASTRATAGDLFTAASEPDPAPSIPAPSIPAPPIPPAAPSPALPAAAPEPDDPGATWAVPAAAAGDDGTDRPKRRAPLLIGAIIVVMVLAVAAYLLFGRGDSTPTSTADQTAATSPASGTATTVATTSSVVVTPPSPPTNLAVSAASPTSLQMTWIDVADNEDRYLVARVRGDVFDEVADLPANSAGYVVDGLEPATLYCLTVAATNGAVTDQPGYVEEACAVTAP